MPITTPFNLLSGGADISESGSPAVGGPAASTDKALVRWNGTAGNLVQNGVVIEADYTGNLTGATDQATTTAAGSGFANQPSNDSITIVSNNAADTQTATVIGTTTATNTVVTEAIALTGTTPVVTVKVDWGQILAIKLSSAAVGTITITKTTGGTTITTLTAAATSKGVTTVTNTAAFNRALSTVASGSTTKQIGWGGTNTSGTQIYDSKALNGTTAVASNSSFYTLTEIYRGDLEASRTATTTTNGGWILTGGGGATLSFDTGGGMTVTPTSGGNFTVSIAGAGMMTVTKSGGGDQEVARLTAPSGNPYFTIGNGTSATTGAAILWDDTNDWLRISPHGSTTYGAAFIPTGILLFGTNITKFGVTAAATIGVSVDTTAGILTFTSPSAGSAKVLGALAVRNIADNADAAITAAAITASGAITVPGTTTAALTSTGTFTSGAGAQVGTLTNAPAAGNPTSWIKIVDNGVTRYFPAW